LPYVDVKFLILLAWVALFLRFLMVIDMKKIKGGR